MTQCGPYDEAAVFWSDSQDADHRKLDDYAKKITQYKDEVAQLTRKQRELQKQVYAIPHHASFHCY
jgi:hypothetical protein